MTPSDRLREAEDQILVELLQLHVISSMRAALPFDRCRYGGTGECAFTEQLMSKRGGSPGQALTATITVVAIANGIERCSMTREAEQQRPGLHGNSGEMRNSNSHLSNTCPDNYLSCSGTVNKREQGTAFG